MNKRTIITVTLVSLAVLLEYTALKSWFDGETKAEREEQLMLPPPLEAVPQNADGTWDFSGVEYQKSTTNWLGLALTAGFVISMWLLVRHLFEGIKPVSSSGNKYQQASPVRLPANIAPYIPSSASRS